MIQVLKIEDNFPNIDPKYDIEEVIKKYCNKYRINLDMVRNKKYTFFIFDMIKKIYLQDKSWN